MDDDKPKLKGQRNHLKNHFERMLRLLKIVDQFFIRLRKQKQLFR